MTFSLQLVRAVMEDGVTLFGQRERFLLLEYIVGHCTF